MPITWTQLRDRFKHGAIITYCTILDRREVRFVVPERMANVFERPAEPNNDNEDISAFADTWTALAIHDVLHSDEDDFLRIGLGLQRWPAGLISN